MKYSLEEEIEKSSKRIEEKRLKLESESTELESKIRTFSYWAWVFVALGFIITSFSIWYYYGYYNESDFGLNLLGDFLGGTVASIWSLAGLFFIYVAFLGQRQQLLHQQLENNV